MNASESSTTNKKPELILVIDDDDNISNMLRIYLGMKGYEVVTTSSRDGEVGLEKALNFQPDLVLLDPLKSGVDGFEILKELRKEIETQNIPLIILQQRDERDYILRMDRPGQDDYITKPFDIEEVALRIKSSIRRK